MTNYKTDDEAFYHESREHLRVAILDRKPATKDSTSGERFNLKVLEVLAEGPIKTPVGLEFEVWRADNTGPQAFGWYLSNR